MNIEFDSVCKYLMEDIYFQNFKFRKKDNAFIQKTILGKNIILLEHWLDWDDNLIIYPIYEVRFDILSVWFEKFSIRTKRDQRDTPYVFFSGEMLGVQDKFSFKQDRTNLKSETLSLKNCVIKTSKTIFEAYSSLQKAYNQEIIPLLEGTKCLPMIGAEWFFENLTLCKIVHPENYEKLKSYQLHHVKSMYERGEPNITAYYDRVDEILSYLENLVL